MKYEAPTIPQRLSEEMAVAFRHAIREYCSSCEYCSKDEKYSCNINGGCFVHYWRSIAKKVTGVESLEARPDIFSAYAHDIADNEGDDCCNEEYK